MEISVSRSRTVNLGNYESEKIQVGVSMEVDTSSPNKILDEAYQLCIGWCEEKVQQEIRKITGEDDGEWK